MSSTRTKSVKVCETPTAKQRRVWDKTASSYDKQIAFFERVQFAGGREWLAERAHGHVLEVAIGTGLNLPHYATDATVTSITGVELSPKMLQLAAARSAQLNLDVALHEGDAANLPVDDETYDTVVCALSLCTIPDPVRAIAEMKRALAPGGTLLLLDHIGSTLAPVYALQWAAERVTTRLAGEHFTRRQLPLVKDAGFHIDEVERLKLGTVERIRATKIR
jgi:ubiquinone/menaquinone biosynthesis C-methylase UbiE